MDHWPRGTVTFLFTDVEGSTALWERHADTMPAAYARHDAILRGAIDAHGGVAFKVIGDAFQAAFPTVGDGVAAARDAQLALAAEPWPLPQPLRVRMAVHSCAAEPVDGDYRTAGLNRLGRLLSAGHGGQVLLSRAAADGARGGPLSDIALRDLGERRLKDLPGLERIFQLDAPGLPETFPPLRTLDPRPVDLPIPPSPLIGRDAEVRAARAQLEHGATRLLTLTGPGGVGKTRLALAIAAGMVDGFADGVRFVPLAAVGEPALVASTIAAHLGVHEESGQSMADTLIAALRQQEMLLVLDNFEQVDDAAPLVAELLAACPGLKVLVTSRTRLRLRAEREFAVAPLATPDPARAARAEDIASVPAAAMFLERAAAAQPGFHLDDHDAAAVANVCVRLDGLPLAIELAAARLDAFTPRDLLARLARRLPELTQGPRDLPARQQTLRDTIAWSHGLLTPAERAAFRRLAIFAGGAGVEAGDVVLTAISGPTEPAVDDMAALIDHSLLRSEIGPGDIPRVRMLETIREYALEQLDASGEHPAARAAHAAYFLDLVEAREEGLAVAQSGHAFAELRVDDDNLRVALDWLAAEPDPLPDRPDAELRLAGALIRYWRRVGRLTEAETRLDGALARHPDGDPAARAKALQAAGFAAGRSGRTTEAIARYEAAVALRRDLGHRAGEADSLQLLAEAVESTSDFTRARMLREEVLAIRREERDEVGIATATQDLGMLALYEGDATEAVARVAEALTIYRRLERNHEIARALNDLTIAETLAGEQAASVAHADESLVLWRTLDDRYAIGWALVNSGRALQLAGRHDEATLRLRDALAHSQETGEPGVESFARYALGLIALAVADHPTARDHLSASLRFAAAAHDPWTIAEGLEALAAIRTATGDAPRAARLLGAAAALRASRGFPVPPAERADLDRWTAAAASALGPTAFASEFAVGQDLPLATAIADALADT